MGKREVIHYDAQEEVWRMERGRYSLHCGECFDLAVGAAWLPCRLELDATGYIILTKGMKLILHPCVSYTVRM